MYAATLLNIDYGSNFSSRNGNLNFNYSSEKSKMVYLCHLR